MVVFGPMLAHITKLLWVSFKWFFEHIGFLSQKLNKIIFGHLLICWVFPFYTGWCLLYIFRYLKKQIIINIVLAGVYTSETSVHMIFI